MVVHGKVVWSLKNTDSVSKLWDAQRKKEQKLPFKDLENLF
jgi:hypothetical protein